jgi:MFS family permease
VAARGGKLPGGEFSALWSAEALSTAGDQLAKVSVSLLVYQQTGSATWSGLAYALTLLPPLVTGPLLAPLADRFQRRELMVACCLQQATLVAVMAIPGIPLGMLVVAVAAVAALYTPLKAAQGALVRNILSDPQLNKAGGARLTLIREAGQLAGLAAAAAAVATIGATVALALDALTFLGAAALLRFGLRPRPAAHAEAPAGDRGRSGALRMILADPPVRILSTLVIAGALTIVPDAVVAPLAEQAGAPNWSIGLLLGADCLGYIIGAHWATHADEHRQRAAIGPLAVLAFAPLALFGLQPHALTMGVLLVASGAGAAYLALIRGEITERVPDCRAGTVTGLLGTGLSAGQGLGVVTAGGLAQYVRSAAVAVALTGAAGVVLSGWCAVRWHRALQAER